MALMGVWLGLGFLFKEKPGANRGRVSVGSGGCQSFKDERRN